ncbi:helix-turn-helix domain-containing protein [Schaalia sp. ZJ405]|uniref:helix-turn-helix domain-containing protein n=1 Tax=Schaalia sp. ZJ405 TaxID=2709403 RepID=UPI0013EC86E3|nr:helix-turn-helix domain-containing protein [Schaalia sp. ZJ405]
MVIEQRYVSIDEAAVILGKSARTIRRYISSGTIRGARKAGLSQTSPILIPLTSLEPQRLGKALTNIDAHK